MSNWQTHETLLQSLRSSYDEAAWERFTDYYQDYIYSVARQMQLNHHDSQDIVQQVLLKSWKNLKDFEYDPGQGKFRGWLCTVTGNTVKNFLAQRHALLKKTANFGESDQNYLSQVRVPEIEKIAEEEWRHFITNKALALIKNQFSDQVFAAFSQLLEGKSIAEVSLNLELKENTIYRYRRRIEEALKQEILRLEYQLN
jgi:RNA polymerase sigma factor (sigma-70 family)